MGFRLNMKWAFPVHSTSLTNSLLGRCSSSVGSREASFDSARWSPLSVISGDEDILYRDPWKAYSYPSLHTLDLENVYSAVEDMKMNVNKISHGGLHAQMHIDEDKTKSPSSVQVRKTTKYSLLMENLDILEQIFADSNVVRLESHILEQLGRLGALNLFHACLSRTLRTPSEFEISQVVVRSGKKEERRSRRERALRKADKISTLSLPSKVTRRKPKQNTFSSAKRPRNTRSRRLAIARNEEELSRGVKMISNLERIKMTWEEEMGRMTSLSSWAEAAGVEERVLQRQLHFGWYCTDELLRSTRTLVIYLARNYRGLGLAFEDLLQAGYLGVLQGAERFDHTRGYRFSTYVQYWIRKSMSTLVARHARGIQIPSTLSRAINQIQKARKALYRSQGKYPEDEELSKFTGLSLGKVRSASKCLRVVGSIDQKMGDFGSVKFLEFTADKSIESPEETVMRQHMKRDTYKLLKALDERERQVVVLRYGLQNCQRRSLEEIGRLFHVSKEWVRRIEKRALKKLGDEIILVNLSHYIDL